MYCTCFELALQYPGTLESLHKLLESYGFFEDFKISKHWVHNSCVSLKQSEGNATCFRRARLIWVSWCRYVISASWEAEPGRVWLWDRSWLQYDFKIIMCNLVRSCLKINGKKTVGIQLSGRALTLYKWGPIFSPQYCTHARKEQMFLVAFLMVLTKPVCTTGSQRVCGGSQFSQVFHC